MARGMGDKFEAQQKARAKAMGDKYLQNATRPIEATYEELLGLFSEGPAARKRLKSTFIRMDDDTLLRADIIYVMKEPVYIPAIDKWSIEVLTEGYGSYTRSFHSLRMANNLRTWISQGYKTEDFPHGLDNLEGET